MKSFEEELNELCDNTDCYNHSEIDCEHCAIQVVQNRLKKRIEKQDANYSVNPTLYTKAKIEILQELQEEFCFADKNRGGEEVMGKIDNRCICGAWVDGDVCRRGHKVVSLADKNNKGKQDET